HPIGPGLHYEEQRNEARRRAGNFLDERLGEFLGYFNSLLEASSGAGFLMGRSPTYVDLSLFQLVAGLRYAFPNAMTAAESHSGKLIRLHDMVAARARVRAYLESPRRLDFNES